MDKIKRILIFFISSTTLCYGQGDLKNCAHELEIYSKSSTEVRINDKLEKKDIYVLLNETVNKGEYNRDQIYIKNNDERFKAKSLKLTFKSKTKLNFANFKIYSSQIKKDFYVIKGLKLKKFIDQYGEFPGNLTFEFEGYCQKVIPLVDTEPEYGESVE